MPRARARGCPTQTSVAPARATASSSRKRAREETRDARSLTERDDAHLLDARATAPRKRARTRRERAQKVMMPLALAATHARVRTLEVRGAIGSDRCPV